MKAELKVFTNKLVAVGQQDRDHGRRGPAGEIRRELGPGLAVVHVFVVDEFGRVPWRAADEEAGALGGWRQGRGRQ